MDQLRARIRLKHYSIRTEDAYVDWVRRFILFNAKRHPEELEALLGRTAGTTALLARLLYGSGLRLLETARRCARGLTNVLAVAIRPVGCTGAV